MNDKENITVEELIKMCNNGRQKNMNIKNENNTKEICKIKKLQITFSIRMPFDLKYRITQLGKKNDRSMNYMIVQAVKELLDKKV